jgi:hypothetical protein
MHVTRLLRVLASPGQNLDLRMDGDGRELCVVMRKQQDRVMSQPLKEPSIDCKSEVRTVIESGDGKLSHSQQGFLLS